MVSDAMSAGLLQFRTSHPSLEHPALSVIVPVRDGEHFLPASLTAVRASDLPSNRWELIVVDHSSRDQSAQVAARYADTVVRLVNGSVGPAFARNRGAEVASGDVLMFVDADVCIHPDALRRVLEIFERQTEVSAVFGTYDLAPAAGGLISQYRNLLHRYVHLRDAGEAVTFWAGCGAVRAKVFAHCGGFDEAPALVAVEDIELGYRMSALGHRIMLRPEIQGSHLKRWTLRSMIVTDVRYRGIPWLRLLMSQKVRPAATLNIRLAEQACTLLVIAASLACFAWLWSGAAVWPAVAVAALSATLAINGPLFAWFARHRGWGFALGAVPLRLLYYALNGVSVSLALLPFSFGGQQTPGRLQERHLEQRVQR
jgi:cellulose synthase/poly-beta-1,6-N-acetylglucosamine synthase-like glycosyltransferase